MFSSFESRQKSSRSPSPRVKNCWNGLCGYRLPEKNCMTCKFWPQLVRLAQIFCLRPMLRIFPQMSVLRSWPSQIWISPDFLFQLSGLTFPLSRPSLDPRRRPVKKCAWSSANFAEMTKGGSLPALLAGMRNSKCGIRNSTPQEPPNHLKPQRQSFGRAVSPKPLSVAPNEERRAKNQERVAAKQRARRAQNVNRKKLTPCPLHLSGMTSTYSITEAQANFPALVRASQNTPITITRRDEVVGYLLSPARMEAIVESMEILANPKAMRAIRDYEKGLTRFQPLSALDT